MLFIIILFLHKQHIDLFILGEWESPIFKALRHSSMYDIVEIYVKKCI